VVRGRRIRRQMQYGEEKEHEYRDELDDDYANLSRDNDGAIQRAPDHLAAVGLEDSDADDDMVSFFW
jgi:RNA polymerase-associated protein CTR9